MTNVDHLARAKDYIAKGEDYYRKAAEEIQAAIDADPTLGMGRVAQAVGRSKSWCQALVQWRTNGLDEVGPFSEAAGKPNRDESGVRKVLRDRPEQIAEAIAQAPAEAQVKIADALIRSQDTEPSLRSVVDKESRPKAPYLPPTAEKKLRAAVFVAFEASELLKDGGALDYDEKYRVVEAAKQLRRLSDGILYLLDTGDIDAEFQALLAEVGEQA